MSTDDFIKNEANSLEKKLVSGDIGGLHNQLLQDSFSMSPENFTKVVDTFQQLAQADKNKGLNIPAVEIHKDGFFGAFGNVDQILLNDGQKQEIYETAAHRQSELEEDPKSWGRILSNFALLDQWKDRIDDKTADNSQYVDVPQINYGQSSAVIRDFTGQSNGASIQLTPEQLQQVRDQLPRNEQ